MFLRQICIVCVCAGIQEDLSLVKYRHRALERDLVGVIFGQMLMLLRFPTVFFL